MSEYERALAEAGFMVETFTAMSEAHAVNVVAVVPEWRMALVNSCPNYCEIGYDPFFTNDPIAIRLGMN